MILDTRTIKEFLSESSVVKPSILYSSLADLIKIEVVHEHIANKTHLVFTKTNHNVFCTLIVPDTGFHIEDECYIVGEKALNGLAQTTASETITIKELDGLLHLIGSGPKETLKCPVIDKKEFPITPMRTMEVQQLESEALYCAKVAGNYISQEQKITAASYVHIGTGGVFSTNNNNIIYYRKFNGLPNIFISADALPVLKPVNEATYTTHGNYDFINYANGYSFGFIKSVIENPINYAPMIAQQGHTCFTIMRQNLLAFCTLVNYASKTDYPVATLKFDGTKVTLDHHDADFNVHVHKEYDVAQGEPCEPFNFSVKWFETFLKPLPYTDLTFIKIGKHFKIITHEDPEFTSIFVAIQ